MLFYGGLSDGPRVVKEIVPKRAALKKSDCPPYLTKDSYTSQSLGVFYLELQTLKDAAHELRHGFSLHTDFRET